MSTTIESRQLRPVVAAGNDQESGRSSDSLTGWAFAAPFALLFALFLVIPAIYGLYLSFTGETLTGANGQLIGLGNYAEAFTDPDMWRSLGNTLWFTLLSTVPLVVLSLAFALLVNLGLPGRWLWRLSFFLPYLLASTVVVLFWGWMYNPKLGLINGVLAEFGIAPVAWLQDPGVAMISVVITTLWWTIGFNFLLYLAALQNIPEQQFEAAAIDGAGKWRQLFSIVIPQLAPTTALIVTLQVLASLKVFDQIYMHDQRRPGRIDPVDRAVHLRIGFHRVPLRLLVRDLLHLLRDHRARLACAVPPDQP
jgi:multiple sugar transport system permease protein